MADWNIQDYRDHRIVFYGSLHCPLPKQLFSLFDKCRTRYEKHPDLNKRASRSSLTFNEEKSEAIQKRFGESAKTLTPTDSMVWVSLFKDESREDSQWLLVGMGSAKDPRTEAGMEAMTGVNQLLIHADHYLANTVYKRLRLFANDNPQRYLKEYLYYEPVVSEDERALERRFDCSWCDEQKECDFLKCGKQRSAAFKAFAEHRLEKEEVEKIREAWEECFPVAVFDMEWEGGHPTQFSGILIEPCKMGVQITKSLDMYIRLPKGMRVSPIVRGLTHISDELLRREGVPIKEALERITAFMKRARVICGQGVRSDIDVLIKAYTQEELEIPEILKGEKILDVSFLVQDMNNLDHVISLKEEAQLSGILHWDERFHDARTDALLAARLLAVYLPGFILRYRKAPIFPMALMRRTENIKLLSDFDGTPKKKPKRSWYR